MDKYILYVFLTVFFAILIYALARSFFKKETPEEPIKPWQPNWIKWWEKEMHEWPSSIDIMPGVWLPVGYVQVNVAKAPLFHLVRQNEPEPYENDMLRNGQTTDAKRIIAKYGKWVMVIANGDSWALGNKVRPFGEKIDGGGLFWKVAHEQIIDGFLLTELDLPEVYIRVDDTDYAKAFRNQ